MNNSIVNVWWRHGIGIGIVLAAMLLFGIAANAAPRGADVVLRGTGKTGMDVTRLVTGDPAQGNDVVAGGWPPRTILDINPVAAKVGSYPPGTSIVDNELRAEVGGFRAWFEVQVSNWDPNGDGSPPLCLYQVKIDAIGYMGVNAIPSNVGVDLAPAVVPCTTDAECAAAFGERWTSCESGKCKAGYLDIQGNGRADSWCAPEGGRRCYIGDVFTGNNNFNYFAVYGNDGHWNYRPDAGIVYYGGTLVLDIPVGARGKYTVNLNEDETHPCYDCTFCDSQDNLRERGFVVNILTGQCCFGLGTPDEGCVDGVLRAECGDDEPGPFIFTPENHCPPQGADCSRLLGSCCETISGECLDEVLEADCQGTHRVWTSGASCGEAACIADIGACCDHDPFGPCTDDTVLSDCRCATCSWHKLQTCSEIECAPTPIPTLSEWGLAIMTLLLLTGAKIYFGRSEAAQEPSDRR